MDEIPDHVFTADKRLYGKLGLHSRATGMRQQPTEAENILWQALRGGQLGAKFRRQHPIDRYIVDLVCIGAKLVVEADGGIHLNAEQADYDAGRSAMLAEMGFQVLRFPNERVLDELDAVLSEIKAALNVG